MKFILTKTYGDDGRLFDHEMNKQIEVTTIDELLNISKENDNELVICHKDVSNNYIHENYIEIYNGHRE